MRRWPAIELRAHALVLCAFAFAGCAAWAGGDGGERGTNGAESGSGAEAGSESSAGGGAEVDCGMAPTEAACEMP